MSALRPVDEQPQTLAEIWNESSLFAPRWVVRRTILTGLVAIAGFAVNEGRWQYSILYLIVGCFGARAVLGGRDGQVARLVRIALDVIATAGTAVLVLQALNLLLGGTVGLIRA